MPESTTDTLFQKAYTNAVLKLLNKTAFANDTSSTLVAPFKTRGVTAGRQIPEEISNNLIFELADKLQPIDTSQYNAAAQDSYTDALGDYLTQVQLNPNPSPGTSERWLKAYRKAQDANEWFNLENKKATTNWIADPDTDKGTFKQWVTSNAPTYFTAKNARDSANEDLDAKTKDRDGVGAAEIIVAKRKLNAATGRDSGPQQGLNMPCSGQTIDNLEAEGHREMTGDVGRIEKPTDIYYRALYTIQGYKTAVEQWTDTFDSAKNETVQISFDQGSNNSDNDSSSRSIAGEASASKIPLIAIEINGESKDNEKTFELAKKSSQVTLALTIKNRELFTIGTGAWDVIGAVNKYPKRRNGAPPLRTLVRPSQVLFASGAGIKITLSGSAIEEYEKHRDSLRKAGGSLNILGSRFQIGANYETKTDSTENKESWDKESGTISIEPSDQSGVSMLMAVIGTKIKI